MSEAQTSKMAVSDETVIKIHKMHKWYGSLHVLKDINLDVKRGDDPK